MALQWISPSSLSICKRQLVLGNLVFLRACIFPGNLYVLRNPVSEFTRLKSKLQEKEDVLEGTEPYQHHLKTLLLNTFAAPLNGIEFGIFPQHIYSARRPRGNWFYGVGKNRPYPYMFPYGRSPLGYPCDRNVVHSTIMNNKPVKKRAIQAWRDGDMANEYNAYQECIPMNGGWHHMEHNDRSDTNRNLECLATWSPSSVSECPSQTDSEVDSDANSSFSHTVPENIDASFYGEEKKKKRSRKKQLSMVLDRISVQNKTEKQKTNQEEVVRISGMGVASERKEAQNIQPIILDFEVPLPKEAEANKDENSLKRLQNSADIQELSEEPSAKKQCNEEPEVLSNKESMPSQADQSNESKQQEGQSDTSSQKSSTSEDLFKKPDINQYKASTGGVRCFICQRQIITDGRETAFFGMVVCVPCKKIQESGGPALPTPVPKFPTACHPKLFRGSKYVRPKYGRSSRSPSPARSPSRSPASSPIPRSPVSPYRSNPVSPFSKPSLSPAVSSPRNSVSATPPASPKESAPKVSNLVSTNTSPETTSDKSPRTLSASSHHSELQQPQISISQPRSLGQSPNYHSPNPLHMSSQSLPASPLHINVSSPSHSKPDKFSPTALHMPAGMHRPPRVLSLPTPSNTNRHTQVELPHNEVTPMPESNMSSQASPQPSQQFERTYQENETIRALLKLRRQDQQHQSGPPPLIQTSASRTIPVVSNGAATQLPTGVIIPGVPPSTRTMYPASIPQGFIPSTPPGGFPRIQMIPLQRMPIEAFPRSDVVQNHMLQPPSGNIRYPGIDLMKTIPIPKISEVRTLNPAVVAGMVNMPMLMQGYNPTLSKRPRKKKNAMIIENNPHNQPGQYRGENPTDQSASKDPLVIVGTNCGAGSSSIKVGNEKEQEPYNMPPQQQAPKPFRDGLSHLLAFHCMCQGNPITFIQCPNCEFICNSVDGMELHFAAQRHAEIRGDKDVNPGKYMSEKGSGKPAGDDGVSLSSMETQSADTDSDLSSPLCKNMQENWRMLNPSSDTRFEKHKQSYTSALDLRVGGSKSGETPERPTPLDLSQKQVNAMEIVRSTSSGQIENTIPLDLSSHIENARLATRESGRDAFVEAARETAAKMGQQDLFLSERYHQGAVRRPPAIELISNKSYLTQSQLESEARTRMILVDNSPLYSIGRGSKVPPSSYEYPSAGPGVVQLVRPPHYPAPSTVANRDVPIFPGTEVTSRDALMQKEQQRLNTHRYGSVTVQQLLRGGPPSQRTNPQTTNLQFHPGYSLQEGIGVSLPLPNLVRAQPRATVAPLVSQQQISYQGGTISVHSAAQQLQQQQDNLRELQNRQREEFERQANLHKEMQLSERRVDLQERHQDQEKERHRNMQERERQLQERERQRDIQEKEMQRELHEREIHERVRRREIQERERHREIQEKEMRRELHEQEMQERERQRKIQREVEEKERQEIERQREIKLRERHQNMQGEVTRQNMVDRQQLNEKVAKNSEVVMHDRQREPHEYHRGPKGKHRRLELQNNNTNQGVSKDSDRIAVVKSEPVEDPCQNGSENVDDSVMHLAEAEQYQVNAIVKQETLSLASA
ncbi:uncharacterized protein [Antedon mediterranea]|uniref:uncharacterized protein n=1 Tax=Antedon mediterranea TaxID=105859 RepID=UPI003AF81967